MKSTTRPSFRLPSFGLLPLVGLFSGHLHAAIITGVTIEDVSSELVNGTIFDRAAIHTINGNGLNPDGSHSIAPDQGGGGSSPGNMWLSNGTFSAPNDPIDSTPPFIEFDLEGRYDLSNLIVWNYNEGELGALTSRGAQDVSILVADTVGGPFTQLGATGSFTFTQAPGDATTSFGQVIDLSGFADADDVRLIRFEINSNYGDANDFVGLSEVRFDGVLIPEPSTALFSLFGLAGLLRRRR